MDYNALKEKLVSLLTDMDLQYELGDLITRGDRADRIIEIVREALARKEEE